MIYADGKLVATNVETVTAENNVFNATTRYMHYDPLGSIDTITGPKGEIVDRLSFDPFGARRPGDWKAAAVVTLTKFTNRGFTGHEHIDEVGLIHMNGRVYDQELGRFLSGDRYIQAPYKSQSFNRYSYVINDPLKYTDPTGWRYDNERIKASGTLVNSDNDYGCGNCDRGRLNWNEQERKNTQDKYTGSINLLGTEDNYRRTLGGHTVSETLRKKYDPNESAVAMEEFPTVDAVTVTVGLIVFHIVAPQAAISFDLAYLGSGEIGPVRGSQGKFGYSLSTQRGSIGGTTTASVANEATTRVRHYTNRKGSKGIEQSGSIRAQDNNRVYLEPANKKALNQVAAEKKYQIKQGRGKDYVETDVPNSQLEWVNNPRYGTPELTVKGDLPLSNPSFKRRK